MNQNSGHGISYIGILAILMLMACFSFGAQLKQTASKPVKQSSTARVPKYSRDWTAIVQKIMSAAPNDVPMIEIAKANGLRVSVEKNANVTYIEFSDPVTNEPLLNMNQIEDSFPMPARAE